VTRLPDLPPVTLSTTSFHDGDSVTMSGRGCVDPDTTTGAGLVVVLRRVADFGRGGTYAWNPTVEAKVDADGTFRGTGTIDQPMFPDGLSTAGISCERPNPDPSRSPTVLSTRQVQVVIVAPPLADLSVGAGTTFDYVLPCTIEGAAYGSFYFQLTAPGKADVGFGVQGTYPQSTSPRKGEHVKITVPVDAAPGHYAATAACVVSEAGTSAYFAHFTVTITAPQEMSPTTPTTTAGSAPGATPVTGSVAFTG